MSPGYGDDHYTLLSPTCKLSLKKNLLSTAIEEVTIDVQVTKKIIHFLLRDKTRAAKKNGSI